MEPLIIFFESKISYYRSLKPDKEAARETLRSLKVSQSLTTQVALVFVSDDGFTLCRALEARSVHSVGVEADQRF